ncbi:16349_t:CDS:2 [Entrophospora sp. SA101]|nr:16349_t:CDS:2 [Entrophospora sp. SA101]
MKVYAIKSKDCAFQREEHLNVSAEEVIVNDVRNATSKHNYCTWDNECFFQATFIKGHVASLILLKDLLKYHNKDIFPFQVVELADFSTVQKGHAVHDRQ